MSFLAKRGSSSFLTKDEMLRFAQHDRMEDVAPSASEGSPWGRRPEGSEGCLAIARQDNKKDARQDNK